MINRANMTPGVKAYWGKYGKQHEKAEQLQKKLIEYWGIRANIWSSSHRIPMLDPDSGQISTLNIQASHWSGYFYHIGSLVFIELILLARMN